MSTFIQNDVYSTHEDTLISDILQLTAMSKYPIAVLDEADRLKGIISKATVLASL